jgi:hypothetical protein
MANGMNDLPVFCGPKYSKQRGYGHNIGNKGVTGFGTAKEERQGGKGTPRDAKEDKRPDGSGSGRAFSNLLIPV